MCLYCTGCGKCIEKSGAGASQKTWTADELHTEASRYGKATSSVVDAILSSPGKQDQAIREALSILNLTERFSRDSVESACSFALGQVPQPRRAFIQAVLESGAYARR